MTENFDRDIEFIKKLRENKVSTPNDFTREMGNLIVKAREEIGLTQAEFAKRINRRPATLSHIENGKSDINISTLVLLAIELRKPVSYFFPETIFRDVLVDVTSEIEHEALNIFRSLQHIGDPELALKILKLLHDYFYEEHKFRLGEYE